MYLNAKLSKLISLAVVFLTPFIFLLTGQASEYGMVYGPYAVAQLSIGWIFSTLQKLYLYNTRHNISFRLYVFLCIGCLAAGLSFNNDTAVTALSLLTLFFLSILKALLQKLRYISTSIIISSCLIPLTALTASLFLKTNSELASIFPLTVFIAATIISLIMIVIVLNRSGLLKNNILILRSSGLEIPDIRKTIVALLSTVALDLETVLVTQWPIAVTASLLGPASVPVLAGIQNIIRLPCFYQGYTNPYYADTVRSIGTTYEDICTLFKRQARTNTLFALSAFVVISSVLGFLNGHSVFLGDQSTLAYIDYFFIFIGSGMYCIIAGCGPVTTTLLALGENSRLSLLSLFSTSLGLLPLLVFRSDLTVGAIAVVSALPAMISNIGSRILLEERLPAAKSS